MSNVDSVMRRSLLAFTEKSFSILNEGRKLDLEPYLALCADKLDQVVAGKLTRLAISLPPRHLKTFLASTCTPAFILGHQPTAKILVLSHNEEKAKEISYDIRELMKTKFYRRAFGIRISKDRRRVMHFTNEQGGGVRSSSIESSLTGFGADYIFLDDVMRIEDWDNLAQAEWLETKYRSELLSRLNNPSRGRIVAIGHRLHEHDFIGRLEKRRGFQSVRLPLIATNDRVYRLSDGRTWTRKKGDLLRPKAFTKRVIQECKESKGVPFSALYQQRPPKADTWTFSAKDIPRTFPSRTTLEAPVVLSVDPGHKAGSDKSYSVIQAWAVTDAQYFLRDQWRQQASFSVLLSQVRGYQRRYRPSAILVEGTANGPGIIDSLPDLEGLNVVEINPVENKIARARGVMHIVRSGKVQLPDEAPWMRELLSELESFPNGPDDQVDAMVQFLHWIKDSPSLHKRAARTIAALATASSPPLPNSLIYDHAPGAAMARFSRRHNY